MTDASLAASPRPRRWRLVVVAAVAFLLAWVGLDLWAQHNADAAFARLQARYGPLDGQSIVAPHVPDAGNRAIVVKAAAQLTVPGEQDANLSAALRRFRSQGDSSPVPDSIRAFVDSNGEAIRVATLALDRRESSWDADYAGGANAPPWLAVRRLSELLSAAACIEMLAGHADQASHRLAVGLAVSASIRQEPSLIAQLMRIATAGDQFGGVQRLVTSSDPSSDALGRLATLLEENRQPDPIQAGLVAELRYANGMLTKLERRRFSTQSGMRDLPIWGGGGLLGRPFVRLTRIEYLRQIDALIASQTGPRPRAPLHVSPPPRWSPRQMAFVASQGLLRAIDTGDTFNSALSVTQIGVALRRYRLDRGEYPGDLSALVPAYLPRLPTDGVTGRPPVYARQGTGFTLKGRSASPSTSADPALDWNVSR